MVNHRVVRDVSAVPSQGLGANGIGDPAYQDDRHILLADELPHPGQKHRQGAAHQTRLCRRVCPVGHRLFISVNKMIAVLLKLSQQVWFPLAYLLHRTTRLELALDESNFKRVQDLHHLEEESVSVGKVREVEEAVNLECGWCLSDEQHPQLFRQIAPGRFRESLRRTHGSSLLLTSTDYIEIGERFGRKLQRRRGEILAQMFKRGRSRDQQDVGRAVKQP